MSQSTVTMQPCLVSSAPITGLSLSLCVASIIEGEVGLDDVLQIVASTAARTERDWDYLLDMYCRSYWQLNPDLARQVVTSLRARGGVDQPRLDNPDYFRSISAGHWLPVV